MMIKFYPWITGSRWLRTGYHRNRQGKLCSVGVSMMGRGVFLLLDGPYCSCR